MSRRGVGFIVRSGLTVREAVVGEPGGGAAQNIAVFLLTALELLTGQAPPVGGEVVLFPTNLLRRRKRSEDGLVVGVKTTEILRGDSWRTTYSSSLMLLCSKEENLNDEPPADGLPPPPSEALQYDTVSSSLPTTTTVDFAKASAARRLAPRAHADLPAVGAKYGLAGHS